MKAAFVLLLVFAACSQPSAPPASVTGTGAAADVALPRVTFPDGYAVHVELATDEATRAQGLMYRDRLRDQTGMLFFFREMSVHGFWMKNTLIPLDMIFIRSDGTIVRIVTAQPHSLEPVSSGEPVSAVLEIAGGRAAQLDIKEGDIATWTR